MSPRSRAGPWRRAAGILAAVAALAGIGLGSWWWSVNNRDTPPITDEFHLIINKLQNRLYVYDDGKLQKEYPIATGRRPDFTPEGAFAIVRKLRLDGLKPDETGRPSPQLGTRWLGLRVPEQDEAAKEGSRYGIHGTDRPDSIGSHASAGCIRMHNDDVEELYEMAAIGTPVYIRSGSGMLQWLRSLGAESLAPIEEAGCLIAPASR